MGAAEKLNSTAGSVSRAPRSSIPESLIKKPHMEDDAEGLWLVSYADMMTLLVGFFCMLLSFSKIDTTQFEALKKETTKVFGGEYKIPFEELKVKLERVVKTKNLDNQVFIQATPEGVIITFRGALFFQSGETQFLPEARDLLENLAPAIRGEAIDFSIIVEGHTDNNPIQSGLIESNWELSSLRASKVLRFFEEKGFNRQRLKAIGWGDTKPVVLNQDPGTGVDLPENQAQNRRVVLRIVRAED